MTQVRYSRNKGGAWRLARRSSHQAVSPLRTSTLSTAQTAMTIRNAARCIITKDEALTARIPTGVTTPTVRRTNSRIRRDRWLVAAAAGLGAAGVVAGAERAAARARLPPARVVDREAGPHLAIHAVDLAAPDGRGA